MAQLPLGPVACVEAVEASERDSAVVVAIARRLPSCGNSKMQGGGPGGGTINGGNGWHHCSGACAVEPTEAQWGGGAGGGAPGGGAMIGGADPA